jgi:hypothetical protein
MEPSCVSQVADLIGPRDPACTGQRLADSALSAILTPLMTRYPVLATRISLSRDRDGRFDIATPLWGREAEAALARRLAAHRMAGLH